MLDSVNIKVLNIRYLILIVDTSRLGLSVEFSTEFGIRKLLFIFRKRTDACRVFR